MSEMPNLDQLTPDQYRARYAALRAKAQSRAGTTSASRNGAVALAADRILLAETIPGGWYQSFRIRRGEVLRIINLSGQDQVCAQIWNAHDTSERFNAGDTIKLQWNALLGRGKLLYSDMGRVLASIIEDTSGGRHDVISGGSTAGTNLARYGVPALRNSRDNFCLAAAKLGLARRDIHPAITFFARVQVDHNGQLVWLAGGAPGDFVDLRAELDLLVTLSNCPHPLNPLPAYAPMPIEALVWRPDPAGDEDECRDSCEEAQRGFDNNAAYLRA
jgi:urea carboxylase-associated protein 2